MGWWLAGPVGIALGLALAVGLDRAAAPAEAQSGGSGITVSVQQLAINQRISQQGVKRANRANSRLDQLKSAATGPTGPAGPAGPAGPGATRISYSAAAGTASQTLLQLAGVTLSASCEVGGAGETNLALVVGVAEATTIIGTSTVDEGTDQTNPVTTGSTNFQAPFVPGPPNSVGGTSAPDGEFQRAFSSLLFVTPTRTISLEVGALSDGAADRCSVNGVAVPA
jgi:hypothetical protein